MSEEKKRLDGSTLVEALHALPEEGGLPFCMPGHKRNTSFAYLQDGARYDITEIAGFDNLHNAEGILAKEMAYAAEVYGVRACRFLVNGSTVGILASILALGKREGAVLITRYCHRSVYNGIALAGMHPLYLPDVRIEDSDVPASVEPEAVAEVLNLHPEVALVVLCSPTYEGVLSDVGSIATICHEKGVPLLVDGAHGAHLGFGGFPESARKQGADMVVESLHKTCASLTQTAILHICSDRVDCGRVDHWLQVLETSSPSYLLLGSICGCVHELAKGDTVALWRKEVLALRKALGLGKLRLLVESKDVWGLDPSKLVLLTNHAGTTGIQLCNGLRKMGIEPEMGAEGHAILMSGMGDNNESFTILLDALKKIDEGLHEKTMPLSPVPTRCAVVYDIHEAQEMQGQDLPLEKAVGKVLGEYIWAYPPGAPLLVPGERLTEDMAQYIRKQKDLGVSIECSRKHGFDGFVRVVD